MDLKAHKIKTYTKLTGVALVILVALIFILSNRDPVTIKFLWLETAPLPKYFFIVILAVGGVLFFWVCRRIGRVIADLRLLRREQKTRRELIEQARQANG